MRMKRLITVTTPGNGKTYEFTVDSKIRTGEAKRAVVREIMSFENGKIFLDEDEAILCSRKHEERRSDGSYLFEGVYADDCEFLLV